MRYQLRQDLIADKRNMRAKLQITQKTHVNLRAEDPNANRQKIRGQTAIWHGFKTKIK